MTHQKVSESKNSPRVAIEVQNKFNIFEAYSECRSRFIDKHTHISSTWNGERRRIIIAEHKTEMLQNSNAFLAALSRAGSIVREY